MSTTKHRWSKIWKLPTNDFRDLVARSSTLKDVIIGLGMIPNTGSYFILKRRIEEEKVDCSHLITRANFIRKTILNGKNPPLPLETVLVINSSYSRQALRRRLIKLNIIEYKCSICKMSPYWNGMELSLQLDHINGINNDNRIVNLRFLCPNCHSQTETFAGRSVKGKSNPDAKAIYYCNNCGGVKKSRKSNICRECQTKLRTTILPLEEVLQYVLSYGFRAASRKYGLSDNAIKKRLKNAKLLPS